MPPVGPRGRGGRRRAVPLARKISGPASPRRLVGFRGRRRCRVMRGLRIGVALAQEHFGFRFPPIAMEPFAGRRRGRDGPRRPPALPAAQVVASGPFGSAWRGPRPSALSSMGPGCDAFAYVQDSRSGGDGGGLRLLPRCVGLGGFGGRRLAGGRCGAGVSRPRVAPSFSAVRPVVLQRPGCRTPPDALIQQRCMRLTGRRPRPTGSGAACFDRIKGAVSLVVTTRSRRVAAQPAGRLSVCAGSRGSVSEARRKIRLAKIPILT